MPIGPIVECPLVVYLVTLHFVLAGFLESIKKYREWDAAIQLSPFADHSIWELAVDLIVCFILTHLIWHFAKFGRLAARVYGYLTLGTYIGSVILYLANAGDLPLTVTPLFVMIGVFHVVCLVPIVWFLQPAAQKELFHVSLIELLIESVEGAQTARHPPGQDTWRLKAEGPLCS